MLTHCGCVIPAVMSFECALCVECSVCKTQHYPAVGEGHACNAPLPLLSCTAEAHRTVLNSILRQMGAPLGESPFAILVEHSKLLDFDIKRRYFRQELDAMTDGSRREDLVLHIRRSHLFADSFRELYHRNPYELQSNLYISFEGEEGQDAGGVQREWYLIISREIFNPGYAMFKTTPGGRTYVPNPSSHINPDHLQYFKFVGRVIAKAIADNKLLDCFFARSFYKHIIGKPVHFSDLEAEDYTFYQSMRYLLEHVIDDLGLELTFSTEVGVVGAWQQSGCCFSLSLNPPLHLHTPSFSSLLLFPTPLLPFPPLFPPRSQSLVRPRPRTSCLMATTSQW